MGIAEVALGAAVLGTGASIKQQREMASDQKRARRTQQRLQQVRQARQRRQQIREAQQARSEALAQAVATGMVSGTGKTSAASHATGAIQSQLASNLSFLDQTQGLMQQQSIFQQRAADHAGRAETFSALSGLAMQAAGSGLFDKKTPETPEPKTYRTNIGAREFGGPHV